MSPVEMTGISPSPDCAAAPPFAAVGVAEETRPVGPGRRSPAAWTSPACTYTPAAVLGRGEFGGLDLGEWARRGAARKRVSLSNIQPDRGRLAGGGVQQATLKRLLASAGLR